VSQPIQVPGGFSIIAVQDTRQVLMPDPRDAVLSLKQLAITFPQGSTQQQAEARINELAGLGQSMGGCGGADAAAARIGAEVVTSDQTRVRDLPGPLQEMLLQMSIGQSTRPFGSFEDGVRILVLCGRDDPQDNSAPSFDAIHAQLSEERINLRSRRYLRDLRRDAVVEYR
jgi:peptidyl-prolyl cis-trans isomerase SurA